MFKYLAKKTLISIMSVIFVFFFMYLILLISNRIKGDQNDINVLTDFFKTFFTKIEFGRFYSDEMLKLNKSVGSYYFERYYLTFVISLIIFGVAFIIGLPIAILLAMHSRNKVAKATSSSVYLLSFIPVAIVLLFTKVIFVGSKYNSFIPESVSKTEMIKSFLIPMFSLSISTLLASILYFQKEISKLLMSDFIVTAKAGGLTRWEIFKHHLARNISILIARKFINIFLTFNVWSMTAEVVFQMPGLSLGIQEAIKYGEINFIMLVFMMFFLKLITINLFSIYVVALFDKSRKQHGLSDVKIINYIKSKKIRKNQFKEIEETISMKINGGKNG